MYKCVHGFAHKLLCDMIVMASDVNVRNTRKSFKYAGGKIWNDLPNNIPNAPSMKAFKYAYKKLNFKHRNTH